MDVQFESFDAMVDYLENEGFSVKRFGDTGAIIFNNGVCADYSKFNTYLTSVTVENDLVMRTPSNAKELHRKTVVEDVDASMIEMYMGVYKRKSVGSFGVLDQSEYTF